MNKNFKQVIKFTLLALFFAFLGTLFQKRIQDTKEVIKEIKTIEKQVDTIYKERVKIEKEVVEKIKYRDRLIEKEKLIVYDTICNEIVDNLKEQLANCDSVVALKDKVIVKTDSIVIFKDRIIDKLVVPKPKPFGIGVQVGATTTDFKEVKPYIGIGISYNLIRF